jgi:hypothetical protein
MKCIKCGKDLDILFKSNESLNEIDKIMNPMIISGYQCVNPDCEIYNQSWSEAEHKDNQDWTIRHIKDLERRILILEDKLK